MIKVGGGITLLLLNITDTCVIKHDNIILFFYNDVTFKIDLVEVGY